MLMFIEETVPQNGARDAAEIRHQVKLAVAVARAAVWRIAGRGAWQLSAEDRLRLNSATVRGDRVHDAHVRRVLAARREVEEKQL